MEVYANGIHEFEINGSKSGVEGWTFTRKCGLSYHKIVSLTANFLRRTTLISIWTQVMN